MIAVFIALAVLLLGYLFYGRLAEKIFGPDDRKTPAFADGDGVDFVPMKPWKNFLVQLLNIAGTGPIFGALMGAVFGPVVFLWIVLGSILGGAVHDYMIGMISCRHDGEKVDSLAGIYLGKVPKYVLHFFLILLMILIGAVFVSAPATLLDMLTSGHLTVTFWMCVILIYYLIATLLPIDKVIGRVYPVFGVFLILMAVCIMGGLIFGGYSMPGFTLENLHPDNLPIWPFMFVTVACGAISGFHSTQSAMVSKCIQSERMGRKIFYGAMICEAVIALTWAAAGVAFYGNSEILNGALSAFGQSTVVYDISTGLLGTVGGILAIIGVIVCPITSGDTALRTARNLIAEHLKLPQKRIKNRLIITIPIFAVVILLTQLNFDVLWRYFAWSNQTLAMIVLWIITAYLLKKGKYRFGSLISALPAAFMSAVSVTYILSAQEGFSLPTAISYPAGILFALALLTVYLAKLRKALTRTTVAES